LSVLFVVGAVDAATTISTNISTGGTLAVTGSSTLTGAISASSTAQITGAFTAYGNSTFGDASTDINLFTGALYASTTALFTNGLTTYAPIVAGGNITVPAGYSLDTATAGVLNLGTTTANAITIGKSGMTTTFPGAVTVSGLTTLGNASTTVLSTTGNILVNGFATTTASNGNIATAGSLAIGAGTAITKHSSNAVSLDFPAITAQSCTTLTLAVTGAADGDTVALGVPNALASTASTTFSGWVSSADTVTVRACNIGAAAIADPAAATVRADVWKH
jgi:hypothetical protein